MPSTVTTSTSSRPVRTPPEEWATRESVIVGLRKNGEEFPADAAISKLEVGGTRVLTVALRDVTEQKRIENEQRFLAEVGPVLATTLDYEETLSRIAELAVRDVSRTSASSTSSRTMARCGG